MPAVASDGASFLVLWADYRSGKNYDIYGAAVRDGKAGTAAAILAMNGEQLAPSACWTGEAYVVGSSGGKGSPSKGALVCRVDRGGKPVGKAADTGGQVGTFDVAVGASGGHGILVTTTQLGKLYNPSHCYAVFLNADGSPAKPDNPGRPPFSDKRVIGAVASAIPLNGRGGGGNVYAPAAAGSGEWLLALYDDVAFDGSWKRLKNMRTVVHYALVRSADGRVGAEGVLADGMRAGAAGGKDGRFLVVYEQHGVKHKVACRLLRAAP